MTQPFNITPDFARKLVVDQFPEFAHLPVTSVEQQGYDNCTFRCGECLLIRMPIAASYALSVRKEQELLPRLKSCLTTAIPEPIKMGYPSRECLR